MYIILEFDNYADKRRKKKEKYMFGPFYPDDDFYDMEEDLVGFPMLAMRDFSGDDDRSRVNKHIQRFLPGLLDPRFSPEQRERIVPRLDSEKPKMKNVTPIYLDNPPNTDLAILPTTNLPAVIPEKEKVSFEVKDLKNVTESR
jgi:hypothetical protein